MDKPISSPLKGVVTFSKKLKLGEKFACETYSPKSNFMVSFEDDGQEAYFYAIDPRFVNEPIRDARLIYDLQNLRHEEQGKSFLLEILWSLDAKKSLLLLDHYAHALIDFEQKRSFCRTGLPLLSRWDQLNFSWHDHLLNVFLKEKT